MKESDLLFLALYGGAFLFMLYIIVGIFYKSDTIIDRPINTVKIWPWSIPYNYWSKWNEITGNLYRMPDKEYIPQKRPWGDSGI